MTDQRTVPKRQPCGFAALLHQVVVQEERGSGAMLAQRAGMSYDMLYARMTGRVPISPGEARRLVAETADQRLADWLMTDTPFVAVRRARPDVSQRDMADTVAAVVRETVDIWRDLARFTDYRQLSPKERADLLREVREAELAIANLRIQLE